MVRLDEHVSALTKVVLANFSDRDPCRRKTRRPPSPEAVAEAERLRGARSGLGDGEHVVIDFAGYVEQTRSISGADDEAGRAMSAGAGSAATRSIGQWADDAEQAVRVLDHRTRPATGELTDPADPRRSNRGARGVGRDRQQLPTSSPAGR